MRQLIFILFLLVSLPAVAVQAEPYGLYDPATGNVVLKELRGYVYTSLRSTSGLLRVGVLSELPVISPADAQLPDVKTASTLTAHYGIGWQIWNPPSPRVPFDFDSITVDRAVPAGTAFADLSMYVSTNGAGVSLTRILIVPEPATLATASVAIVSLAALRRRK